MVDSWEKVIDPNFINAELIGEVGAEKVVTVKDINYRECFDQKTSSKIQKMSLIFEECKPMILNKTNSKTLKKLFSPNSDEPQNCIGHRITLYVVPLHVGGKSTTGIRIKEFSEEKCPVCGKIILPCSGKTVAELKEISQRNFNQIMCGECMKKKAKESKDDK